MKSIKTTTFLGLAILFSSIFLNQSCSIQKRTYNKGYFVQWNINKKISENKTSTSSVYSDEILSQNEAAESNLVLEENETMEAQLLSTSNTISEKNELIQDNVFESENQKEINNSTINFKQNKQVKKTNSSFKNVRLLKKESKQAYFNWDLGINILLTVVFLGLIILFLILALNAVMPTILIWGILGLISLVLFITQVIDLINY